MVDIVKMPVIAKRHKVKLKKQEWESHNRTNRFLEFWYFDWGNRQKIKDKREWVLVKENISVDHAEYCADEETNYFFFFKQPFKTSFAHCWQFAKWPLRTITYLVFHSGIQDRLKYYSHNVEYINIWFQVQLKIITIVL